MTRCIVSVFVVLLWLWFFSACNKSEKNRFPEKETSQSSCGRIVSLAPSITETLFALGLGENVVGVTRYCDYPEEAKTKTRIGGYINPNYETIARLKPDLVVLLKEHQLARKDIDLLGPRTLVVESERVSDIYNSMRKIGKTCQIQERSRRLIDGMEKRFEQVRSKTAKLPRPRVLLSVGRSMGTGSIKDVFVAGSASFYNEVLALAGGENAYKGARIQYPRLSAEGILEIDPDIIVDLVANLGEKGLKPEEIVEQWIGVGSVRAAKQGRVYVMGQDYVVLPGPRVVLLVEELAKKLHPEVDWETK